MDQLRGNTFLLLRAGNDTLLTPQEYGDSKSWVTRPNMLLISSAYRTYLITQQR